MQKLCVDIRLTNGIRLSVSSADRMVSNALAGKVEKLGDRQIATQLLNFIMELCDEQKTSHPPSLENGKG